MTLATALVSRANCTCARHAIHSRASVNLWVDGIVCWVYLYLYVYFLMCRRQCNYRRYNTSEAVSCTASPYVAAITFVVAGLDTSMWPSRGISQSAPTYSGSNTTTTLTVEGIMANNGLHIHVTCRVFVGSTYEDILPPAVVTVGGW